MLCRQIRLMLVLIFLLPHFAHAIRMPGFSHGLPAPDADLAPEAYPVPPLVSKAWREINQRDPSDPIPESEIEAFGDNLATVYAYALEVREQQINKIGSSTSDVDILTGRTLATCADWLNCEAGKAALETNRKARFWSATLNSFMTILSLLPATFGGAHYFSGDVNGATFASTAAVSLGALGAWWGKKRGIRTLLQPLTVPSLNEVFYARLRHRLANSHANRMPHRNVELWMKSHHLPIHIPVEIFESVARAEVAFTDYRAWLSQISAATERDHQRFSVQVQQFEKAAAIEGKLKFATQKLAHLIAGMGSVLSLAQSAGALESLGAEIYRPFFRTGNGTKTSPDAAHSLGYVRDRVTFADAESAAFWESHQDQFYSEDFIILVHEFVKHDYRIHVAGKSVRSAITTPAGVRVGDDVEFEISLITPDGERLSAGKVESAYYARDLEVSQSALARVVGASLERLSKLRLEHQSQRALPVATSKGLGCKSLTEQAADSVPEI